MTDRELQIWDCAFAAAYVATGNAGYAKDKADEALAAWRRMVSARPK